MSIRDTQEYKKGREAETFICERWKEKGKIVTSYSEKMSYQKRGIDYSIKEDINSPEIFYDNKNNMFKTENDYLFAVEIEKEDGREGWVFTSEANKISHSNLEDQYVIQYDLDKMRSFIKEFLEKNPSRVKRTRKGAKLVYLQVEAMKRKGIVYEI